MSCKTLLAAALISSYAPNGLMADSQPEPDTLPIPLPAVPQGPNCDVYARAYADSYRGSGDPTGDIVAGGMEGAVAGGAWRGPGGARRGARAGGALAVLDNLAAYPGGWQALYDMAYQICRNETSGVTHRPNTLGDPSVKCRSRAGVASSSSRAPLGARSGGSGLNCR
ncbi:hypothetical protein [Labrenzia sp. CE80]|uniref:hypothetical protein n=1 Tax=Labrenzia sp. CE80 TaxID=1788986 RepID=UPI001AD8DA84|nr:hypothetical protein [Labrenzia sp. CE80]